MINNLSKLIIDNGGSIIPLLVPSEETQGLGLCNSTVHSDGEKVYVNIRNVHYTLHHNERNQKFQNIWSGPLQYLNPEDDLTLTSTNFLCELNPKTLEIEKTTKVDTSKLDVKPLWEFVGLEDARLVNWDDKLFMCGVRRDTTTNGEGRMELSEVVDNKEISRNRIEVPPTEDYLYCEKNWMPVVDMPYHFIKWGNPTELVKVDLETNTSEFVVVKEASENVSTNLRGGSQVITLGEYRIALIHEVFFPYNKQGHKDAIYTHQFIVWDKDWNIVYKSQSFNFMTALIEFACGMTIHNGEILITFGFQDNASYLIRIPMDFFKKLVKIDTTFKDFDWGEISENEWFLDKLEEEIILGNIYQKFFNVEKNDVVVDVGASSGPFTKSILKNAPKKIYCLEPSKNLYKTLSSNFKDVDNIICINKGIINVDGKTEFNGIYNPKGYYTGGNPSLADGIKFSTFINEYNIKTIDFLKLNCEGGEYDIFNSENEEWIFNNVRKISGEFHLDNDVLKEKFRHFRDNYLTKFKDFEIYSSDGIDIKWDLFNDHFMEYYQNVDVYINNKPVIKKKDYWKTTKYPTLEFTTSIPVKGCVVDCAFCPQRTLVNIYDGERVMSYDNFTKIIDKLPKEIRITFSGFVEPWLNKRCTDMLVYAHEKGHPISLFTTGIGMTVDDIDRIKNIPFSEGPNGGFCLHLPDQERIAKHPMSERYIKVLERIKEVQNEIQGFYLMSMGEVLDEIKYIFPTADTPEMWSRAGNLLGEAILKPELDKIKHRFKHINHGSNKKTCGCDEDLYHNVVLPNGDVSLCCMDYGLKEIIGNLYTEEYNNIIPKPNTCFTLCQKCENGIHPK